ncbi:hypothetical protein [Bacillus sp. Marseille-P3800]|nr:hypothetical protein [Bacillus sp. Marseille-P3800]
MGSLLFKLLMKKSVRPVCVGVSDGQNTLPVSTLSLKNQLIL